MDDRALLLITVALLTIYTIGIGGSTAIAIRIRDAFRRRGRLKTNLDPRAGEVVLRAPTLPRFARVMRTGGWIAFPVALGLALFADVRYHQWLTPLTVLLMVGLNAFYFTAMQGIGEQLTLTGDGFKIGKKKGVRWVHVTDLMGAHIGAFGGMRMSEAGEWEDPRSVPNVIFYRLNRALVRPQKTLLQRLRGLIYYDGIIRNVFGLPTELLIQAMRTAQRQAIDDEPPPFRRPRAGETAPVRSPEP